MAEFKPTDYVDMRKRAHERLEVHIKQATCTRANGKSTEWMVSLGSATDLLTELLLKVEDLSFQINELNNTVDEETSRGDTYMREVVRLKALIEEKGLHTEGCI